MAQQPTKRPKLRLKIRKSVMPAVSSKGIIPGEEEKTTAVFAAKNSVGKDDNFTSDSVSGKRVDDNR